MEFRDILNDYKVPYEESGKKSTVGWINLRCCYCDKDPYLGYSLAGRFTHCWSCGSHPLWEVIQLLTLLPINRVFELVKDLPQERVSRDLEKRGKLHLPDGLGGLSEYHVNYLKDRGFDPLKIKRLWGIKGLGMVGSMRWRIWIPVHFRGEIVSWTTRSIIKDSPHRYLSAKWSESAIPIESLLYGIDYVMNSVIIVEGPLDVWKIGPGAVALMGLRVSCSQLEQISRIPQRIICFDNESKAQERARKLMNDFSVFPGTTRNITLIAKDPGSATEQELNAVRKELQWKC